MVVKIKGLIIGLASLIVINSASIVNASQDTSNISNTADKYSIEAVYKETAETLGLKYEYVQTIADIAGNDIVFAESIASAYTDETIESLPGVFEIDGVIQIYNKKAPYIDTTESAGIDRPSRYYIPDASYNVMSSINDIMKTRQSLDRGNMNIYIESMIPEAKENLIFYESVLQYLGYSNEIIENFSKMYLDILNSKDRGEYIVQHDNKGYSISDKFSSILDKHNIPNERSIALLLSYDSLIVNNNSILSLQDEIMIPYKVGYTTRENLVLAATSLVGKVRYVWGGGHGGTGNLAGINPIWFSFNELYNDANRDACISPASTWCPMHNTTRCDSLSDTVVHSIDEYLSLREPYIKDTDAYNLIKNKNIEEIFNTKAFSLPAHRFDGLDCSGFVSWVYNQIDPIRTYDSTAKYFVQSGNLKELSIGDKLLAGDVIAWDTHICMVIGAVNSNNTVYTVVESTPNVIAFGTAYYPSASSQDISLGRQIAYEANSLFGVTDNRGSLYNLGELEYTTEYIKNPEYDTLEDNTNNEENITENDNTKDTSSNIDVLKPSETQEIEIPEYITVSRKSLSIGRLNRVYLDETTIINKYNKCINDMTSVEILQHTIDNMPYEYIGNTSNYTGEIFNVKE